MRKKLFVLLLAGTMIFATACSGTGTSGDASGSAESTKSTGDLNLEYVSPSDLAAEGVLTTDMGGGGQAPADGQAQSGDSGSGEAPSAPPEGEAPTGTPPEKPEGGGADTQNFDYSGSYTGALTADGKEVTSDKETIEASKSDQNALLANNGGTLTATGATITKSGDDTDGDRCNFYGLNSSVLSVGEKSNVYLSDSTVKSTSTGSNALFATDSGTIYANSVDITTTKGDNSRGLDATYGGVIYGNDLNISTEKAHCAALATDRGGGYISVTGSTLETKGSGSPLLYSTGDIEVDNVTGTASGSQIAGMEGYNRIIIYNSDLKSTNDATSGSDPIKNGVILYQSMSGDADTSTTSVADFEAVNSKLTTAITDGAMFYVTNTKAKMVLKDTEIQTGSDDVALIQATGNSSNNWGTEGKNGGTLTFTGYGESLSGNIIADTISSVDFYLMDNSNWTGATEIQENSKGSTSEAPIKISVDGTSTWTVTEDCTVSALAVAEGGKVVDSQGKTVTIKADGKTFVEGDSDITVTVTGSYTTEVEAGELTQAATKVLDRSEFDSHYGTTTKFGYAGKE